MKAEAAQVAGLGQNGERIDGADSRDRAQEAIVRMVGEKLGAHSSMVLRCWTKLRACARIRRNMRIASESGATGNATEDFDVS